MAPIARLGGLLALSLDAPLAAQDPDELAPGVRAAWVELGTTGLSLRAVTAAAVCPRVAALEAGEAPNWVAAMSERAQPAPPEFPDRVCEWSPPATARFAAAEDRPDALRLPGPNPRRRTA